MSDMNIGGLDLQQLLNLEGVPGVGEGEEVVVYEKLELQPIESHPTERNKDLENDYKLARTTAHYMNQMMMNMAEVALHNAKNSESPRHVEVFTQLMSQINTSNLGMIKLHKDMREITEEKTPIAGNADNKPSMKIESANVFFGSPSDLMQQVGSSYEPKQNDFIDAEVVDTESGLSGDEDGKP